MGFRVLVINTHSKLSYKNNHLYFKAEGRVEPIHLSEIDMLVLETTDIAITTMLLAKLMRQNTCVIFCDEKRLPSAQLVPFYGRHDSALAVKNQIAWSDENKATVTHEILRQKIKNQSLFLDAHGFCEKAEAVRDLLSELELNDPSNREGHAARIFFNALYGNDFSRDDVNEINAALDYGYTLIMSVFAREIVKCGCLTQLGINHRNQFNPYNLASDLMEPFRVLADEIVYEHRNKYFEAMKWRLFELFEATYAFGDANMFLNNIAGKYVKSCIAYLGGETRELPVFEYAARNDGKE
ncbi:MAG: type II CRISPR-associated endonuclease Cas1 [Defluviitaleaceae bacterium]|nr:type II CRISPR-associated endonuclease Cas1 [Defluviitaleaceae bacterium]